MSGSNVGNSNLTKSSGSNVKATANNTNTPKATPTPTKK